MRLVAILLSMSLAVPAPSYAGVSPSLPPSHSICFSQEAFAIVGAWMHKTLNRPSRRERVTGMAWTDRLPKRGLKFLFFALGFNVSINFFLRFYTKDASLSPAVLSAFWLSGAMVYTAIYGLSRPWRKTVSSSDSWTWTERVYYGIVLTSGVLTQVAMAFAFAYIEPITYSYLLPLYPIVMFVGGRLWFKDHEETSHWKWYRAVFLTLCAASLVKLVPFLWEYRDIRGVGLAALSAVLAAGFWLPQKALALSLKQRLGRPVTPDPWRLTLVSAWVNGLVSIALAFWANGVNQPLGQLAWSAVGALALLGGARLSMAALSNTIYHDRALAETSSAVLLSQQSHLVINHTVVLALSILGLSPLIRELPLQPFSVWDIPNLLLNGMAVLIFLKIPRLAAWWRHRTQSEPLSSSDRLVLLRPFTRVQQAVGVVEWPEDFKPVIAHLKNPDQRRALFAEVLPLLHEIRPLWTALQHQVRRGAYDRGLELTHCWTVADHTALMIVFWYEWARSQGLSPADVTNGMRGILMHDADEALTGDQSPQSAPWLWAFDRWPKHVLGRLIRPFVMAWLRVYQMGRFQSWVLYRKAWRSLDNRDEVSNAIKDIDKVAGVAELLVYAHQRTPLAIHFLEPIKDTRFRQWLYSFYEIRTERGEMWYRALDRIRWQRTKEWNVTKHYARRHRLFSLIPLMLFLPGHPSEISSPRTALAAA